MVNVTLSCSISFLVASHWSHWSHRSVNFKSLSVDNLSLSLLSSLDDMIKYRKWYVWNQIYNEEKERKSIYWSESSFFFYIQQPVNECSCSQRRTRKESIFLPQWFVFIDQRLDTQYNTSYFSTFLLNNLKYRVCFSSTSTFTYTVGIYLSTSIQYK